MEPLTFALTIVSALSLYSLFMTIYNSRWTWNAGSTALFLGLVSWLLAGLSGVVNATIAWDSFVHNTLWIVGHFHHMALLNIGIVIFGALYAFLPDLLGRPLYSDRLGMWHVWLTFFAGDGRQRASGSSRAWRAPRRRFAVLPGQYDQLTDASIPLVVDARARAAALRVEHRPDPARQAARASSGIAAPSASPAGPRAPQRGAQGFVIVTSPWSAASPLGAGAGGIGTQPGGSGLPAAPSSRPASGADAAGQQVFMRRAAPAATRSSAADATGTVGPNLDQAKPDKALVVERVTNGQGAMPAFKGSSAPARSRPWPPSSRIRPAHRRSRAPALRSVQRWTRSRPRPRRGRRRLGREAADLLDMRPEEHSPGDAHGQELLGHHDERRVVLVGGRGEPSSRSGWMA